jgi:threonine/homoserine/homoserine lactone efflux protein
LEVDGKPAAYFLRGLTVQMTNPKAALTWIAIMSLGVEANAPAWVGASIVFGTGVLSVVGHTTYALAFSTQPMVAFYRRARRWIEVALGAFFCFAGIKLLTSRT